ncbi:DUF6088 family protein [Curtobacterium sp. PhB136]|uniref:DUF6088 family protein n=1 Tax=Curtobacterium sp. PhB136 TaxID=2485181 RepID=UPI00104668A1|nr:DUF6088 family protein [Curtobacterium sp. PhB136]
MSQVTSPGAELRALPAGSYVRIADLRHGSSTAKRSALSHAVRSGDLVRLHAGLYFKGERTRFGMTRPRLEDIAFAVLGTSGTGPAEYSAARYLGLTTQVPKAVHVATVGHPPDSLVKGVEVHTRRNRARLDLNRSEIAVLEVLRDPGNFVERGWAALVDAVRSRISDGDVRIDRLRTAADSEHSRATHANAGRLLADIGVA